MHTFIRGDTTNDGSKYDKSYLITGTEIYVEIYVVPIISIYYDIEE